MLDLLLYLGCGLSAGLLGGYLGLGGGIVMVPYLNLLSGMSIFMAVPVSLVAVAVNSLSASTEYLKKGMVDLQLAVILILVMVTGNISGSLLNGHMPDQVVRIIFTVVLLYAALAFITGKGATGDQAALRPTAGRLILTGLATLLAGVLAGLLGIGGGIVLIPAMVLITGRSLGIARGTSSFLVGFSAAASTVVFLFQDKIDLNVVGPVVLGILIGGRLGGRLGTMAKPTAVRIVLFAVMIYSAVKIGWEPIRGLFQ